MLTNLRKGAREKRIEVTKIILSKAASDIYSNNCFFRVLGLVSIQCLLSFREAESHHGKLPSLSEAESCLHSRHIIRAM